MNPALNYRVERCFYASGARAGQPTGHYQILGQGEPVKLPSVTTIIKAGLPAPQLIKWALETGVKTAIGLLEEASAMPDARLTGEVIQAIREQALAAPDRFRDEAADIGTQVHEAIEAWLRGKLDLSARAGWDKRVSNGFDQFLDFWQAGQFELMPEGGLEQPVASLRHGFAGTVDCLALDANFALTVMDWKTSKGIYESHEIQAVAYAVALEEMGFGRPERVLVARFGRDDARFEVREIDPALWPGHFDQFLRCAETRRWLKAATARYWERRRAGEAG